MDCIGLQALSDSSESDIEESFVRINYNDQSISDDHTQGIEDIPVEPSKQEKQEYLYKQYKDGLKILMKGDYDEAEKSFEEILSHSYLKSVIL